MRDPFDPTPAMPRVLPTVPEAVRREAGGPPATMASAADVPAVAVQPPGPKGHPAPPVMDPSLLAAPAVARDVARSTGRATGVAAGGTGGADARAARSETRDAAPTTVNGAAGARPRTGGAPGDTAWAARGSAPSPRSTGTDTSVPPGAVRTGGASIAVTLDGRGAGHPARLGDVRPDLLVAATTGLLAVGMVLGAAFQRVGTQAADGRLKPRYPRDWHRMRDLFTTDPKDPRKPGYLEIDPRRALGTGHTPLGRTFPRWFGLVPDVFPFQELRRRVQFATSRPVFIPYTKRFVHRLILGGTGKGKSTSMIVPALAYGALERQSAYFSVDVKSPEMRRLLVPLYQRAGKEVFFIDPWSLDETRAMEPVWRATDEQRELLADVIASYSPDPMPVQETGNSAFFRDKSLQLIRSGIELLGYWPRRYAKLPCLQQLIAAGALAVKEAFQRAPGLLPTRDALLQAAEAVVSATDAELDATDRAPALSEALAVVDRSGFRIATLVKEMRRYRAQHRAGELSDAQYREASQQFVAQLGAEYHERAERLTVLIQSQGELLNGHEETLKGVVSTVTTKVGWFRHPRIAKVFSRDEFDVAVLTERPCLVLIGAPQAKRNIGSLFVTSLITNLALNGVYQRGMRLQRGEDASRHGIFFELDEYAQLGIRDTPNMAALFRGFFAGLTVVIQERSMLRHLHGELAQTLEGVLTHKILYQGAHEETAKFYATDNIGECTLVQRTKSGPSGKEQQVTETPVKSLRITPTELRDMVINGKRRAGVAMSVGADAPAHPLLLVPYDQDPVLRSPTMLNLARRLDRRGKDDRPTWRFWEWRWKWEPPKSVTPLIQRHYRRPVAERAAGVPDPVHARLEDPFRDYVDFLLGEPGHLRSCDELVAPRLVLADVGVVEHDPARPAASPQVASAEPAGVSAGASVAAAATGASEVGAGVSDGATAPREETTSTSALPADVVAPAYVADFHSLLNADYEPPDLLPALPPLGGPLRARLEAFAAVRTGAVESALDGAGQGSGPRLLLYDPSEAPGSVADHPSGASCVFVAAETYYRALLATRLDVNKVFIHAAVLGRVPSRQLREVDDAIAAAYWDTFLGCLMPPRVLAALDRAVRTPPDHAVTPQADGRVLLELLEQLRRESFAAASIGDALDAHTVARVELLVCGAHGRLTERQVTVGEVLSDYLLLQRGIMEDVRRAERERDARQPRGTLLERYELDDTLTFYDVLGLVHQTERIAERIPGRYRARVETFADARPQGDGPRVFARRTRSAGDADDSADGSGEALDLGTALDAALAGAAAS